MLTLKQKLELFKLAKKPRKEIRLKLQAITHSLNLPSLHKTSKNLRTSEQHQKVVSNLNNFKKIDKTKQNFSYVNQSMINQSSEGNWIKQKLIKQNKSDHKSRNSLPKSKVKLNHFSGLENLLLDFDFNVPLKQKQTQWHQRQMIKQKQNCCKLKQHRKAQSMDLIRLKNQYNTLKNMNRIYKHQLQNAKTIDNIARMANKKTQTTIFEV